MAQIKITHTSNADMNIGVPKQITMEQQTYGEWMRSNPKAPTDKYKTKPTENVTNNHTLTAVEWLAEELKSKGHALITTEGIFINVPNELLEQAKQMEKEQLKDAYWNGTIDMEKEDAMSEAEDFYNAYYTK